MKKKFIVIFFILFLIIIIFVQSAYKLSNSGNTINKSDVNNILNIQSYEAVIEVQINSNKNTNKYIISQKYAQPNIYKQEIIEPENLKGLTTIFDGNKLIIENKALSLKKIYEKYQGIQGNSLSLIRFVQEYKNAKDKEEIEAGEEKIIKIKLEESTNKYEKYKKLYINQKTNLPTKLEILDINQNRTVYILYNEIKINKTSQEEILKN